MEERQLVSYIAYCHQYVLDEDIRTLYSEPDITLMGKNGLPWGVIEVKGGTDSAGALERYGAAKKSFENTRKDAPDAKTILIASCITNEANERITSDKTIDSFFNLTEVIREKERYDEFVNLVFSVLGEVSNS